MLAVSLCLTLFITEKSKTTALIDFDFFFSGDSRRGGASFAHCITRAERVML